MINKLLDIAIVELNKIAAHAGRESFDEFVANKQLPKAA